ncbi:hypothetical protein JRQ81_015563 [Phrynocephalus forsythii]|uniref:Acrosin n=1 Tax=Phrynocephalus forsythii TaxID=171643 RepID=A0A9Q1B2A0_9SAUR|nr:hypothetical protein JRQ81_015563 [Phrynocephalus forsythii]
MGPRTTFSHCYISGWGTTSQNSAKPSDVLQEAKVILLKTEKCNSSQWYNGALGPHTLCAGYQQGGIDSCQGDSGGPLMCKTSPTSVYYIVGITSWGKGCAQAHSPGIYTSTKDFLKWILGQMLRGGGRKPTRKPGPPPTPAHPGGITLLPVTTLVENNEVEFPAETPAATPGNTQQPQAGPVPLPPDASPGPSESAASMDNLPLPLDTSAEPLQNATEVSMTAPLPANVSLGTLVAPSEGEPRGLNASGEPVTPPAIPPQEPNVTSPQKPNETEPTVLIEPPYIPPSLTPPPLEPPYLPVEQTVTLEPPFFPEETFPTALVPPYIPKEVPPTGLEAPYIPPEITVTLEPPYVAQEEPYTTPEPPFVPPPPTYTTTTTTEEATEETVEERLALGPVSLDSSDTPLEAGPLPETTPEETTVTTEPPRTRVPVKPSRASPATTGTVEPPYIPAVPAPSLEPPYIPPENPVTLEPPYIPTEETAVTLEPPYTPDESTFTLEPPYTPSESARTLEPPYTPSEKQYTLPEAPYIPKETQAWLERPFTPSESPYRPPEPPYIPREKTPARLERPYTPPEAPYPHLEAPYIAPDTIHPTLHPERPYVPQEKPHPIERPYTPPEAPPPRLEAPYIPPDIERPLKRLKRPPAKPRRLGSPSVAQYHAQKPEYPYFPLQTAAPLQRPVIPLPPLNVPESQAGIPYIYEVPAAHPKSSRRAMVPYAPRNWRAAPAGKRL